MDLSLSAVFINHVRVIPTLTQQLRGLVSHGLDLSNRLFFSFFFLIMWIENRSKSSVISSEGDKNRRMRPDGPNGSMSMGQKKVKPIP